tara:strand:- start:13 stop:150 length:138 start_codon:yes stop_codon:yes gene_type:complete
MLRKTKLPSQPLPCPKERLELHELLVTNPRPRIVATTVEQLDWPS